MTLYNPDSTSNTAANSTDHSNASLCMLIEAIGKHAADEKEEELKHYQAQLAAQSEGLKNPADEGKVRAGVSAVIELMANHNRAVMADHRQHSEELARALRMMVETIGHVSKSSQASVHQLSVIEKNLVDVSSGGGDPTRLRSKLEVCLKMIREHSEILRVQSEEQVNSLKSYVASAAPAMQSGSLFEDTLDTVTGLPTRGFAENLIDDRLSRKTDCLAGVVTIDRFVGLQSRFGPAIVDDLIRTVAHNLAQRLPEATALCRWSPNSFLAVTDIVSSYAETSQQWRRVLGLKVEKQIEDPTRTALVVLSTSLMVEHLRATSSKRAFIQNIDRFVAQQSGVLVA